MNRKAAVIVIAGGVLIAIGLSLAFALPLRNSFRSNVVEPFVSSFYLFRWYLHRISQAVLWAMFILGGGILLMNTFMRTFSSRKREDHSPNIVSTVATSELNRLTTIISHTHRRPFARRRMTAELVGLAIRMIAKREGLSLKAARARFETFDWCDNEAIPGFFKYRRQYYGIRRGKDFNRLLKETISFFERYYQGV